MDISFNADQTKTVVAYRNQFVEYQKEIDQAKENQKGGFDALFDKLRYDKKVDGDKMKAIKQGFKLYYKQNAQETQKLTDEAVAVAEL
jgi:hypothetical protein